ncbi:MAG TPA: metalloregulator ArsR/SmtB family transcription factor [Chloroflexota bacterium]
MATKQRTTPRDPINLERARRRLNARNARQAMTVLRKALCEPARLEIIEALSAGELCVNDLALVIGRAPAATSQHLRVLREMDLVTSNRRGTSVYYTLHRGAATQLEGVLDTLRSANGEQPARNSGAL